jgi:putative thioredoxin
MDITTVDFENEVLEASKGQPVLVDFWAPWCGPCRALTPILEKLAREFAGKVKLVKVNSDKNQDIAAAFGIRSIPTVIAFKDGRPAAQFMGAQPEGQVRAFIERLLPSGSELALARAEQAYAENRLEDAERELALVKYDPDWDAKVEALKQGIAFARASKAGPDEGALRGRPAAYADDHDARLALAGLLAAARRYREALDELLEIVRRAKDWRDGEARRQVLAIFALAEDQPELVGEYRRKLARLLY